MITSKFHVRVVDASGPGSAVLHASGVLDAESAPVLEDTLRQLFDDQIFNITVDLAEVEFISSAGWGVFTGDLKFAREHGGDIKLVALKPDVLDIFLLLELDHFIHCYPSIEEALKAGTAREEPARPISARGRARPQRRAASPSVSEPVPRRTTAKAELPSQISLTRRSDGAALPSGDGREANHGWSDKNGSGQSEADKVQAGSAMAGFLHLGGPSSAKDEARPNLSPDTPQDGRGKVDDASVRKGIWGRIFGRRSKVPDEARDGRHAASSNHRIPPEAIRWGSRRGESDNNLAFQPGRGPGSEANGKAVSPADGATGANHNGKHVQRAPGWATIAAVVQENPALGPTRIKRRLDELAGGDCRMSITTIYRRLRAARLNTRELRLCAFASDEVYELEVSR